MTRIKCCGITRAEDALLAARLGVDAIGLIFTARSRRCLTPAQGAAIRACVPAPVRVVALFMDDDAAFVRDVYAQVQPDLLQFHGRESDDWCAQFGIRYFKAIGMADGDAALRELHAYPRAYALLLDGHGAGEGGGRGQGFDWSRIPPELAQPVILAGGLHAGNVAAAIRQAQPWAVDVSSGVECAPGIKDAARLEAFVAAVREADGMRVCTPE